MAKKSSEAKQKKEEGLWDLQPKTNEIHGGGSVTDKFVRPRLAREVAPSLGTYKEGAEKFAGTKKGFIYTRMNNETVDRR